MMRTFARSWILVTAALIAACGGGDDDGASPDGGDGDGDGDGDVCGFGTSEYLPYDVGVTWTYRLTDLGSGERATKEQRIDPEMEHPDYGAVVVQITGKVNGQTISLSRKEGDRVLRFQQEDRDATGALERTTVYQPPQIRIDESAERTEAGAEWDESYTEIVTDPDGVELMRVDTVDHWEVLGVDVPCESPMGAFECLSIRRTRTQGGVAEKEFQFARGIGKIREVGQNQLEELIGCGE
jgi:hypothetical protein